MYKLKIRDIGSSLGAIFPKEALSDLHAEKGDTVYMVKEEPGVYRLSKYDPEFEIEMEAFRKGMKRYKNTLRELSKK